jgi:hypothetical protein
MGLGLNAMAHDMCINEKLLFCLLIMNEGMVACSHYKAPNRVHVSIHTWSFQSKWAFHY